MVVLAVLGAAEAKTLKGTVTGPDGTPVDGAAVSVYAAQLKVESLAFEVQPVGQTTTCSSGLFSVETDVQMPSSEGGWLFFAEKPGLSIGFSLLQDVSEDTTSLQLTAPQTLAGRIEDIHGNALAEANVNVQFRGSSWSSSLQGYTAKTDQDGLYRIAAVPSEQQYFLSIAGPRGYGTGSQALELSQDSFETTVPDTALKLANLTVTGQVVDEDGNPLEGVNLHCYGAGQPSANVRTDKDGRFVFDAVCQGDLSVQANYQKGGEYMYSNIRTEGGAQEVTIVLSPQSSGGRFVPRQPASLVGKPLPDLSGYGIKLEGQAGPALVCVWDWRQRPSRYMVRQLAERAGALAERSVQVVLLNGESTEREPLEAWLADFDIPFVCGVITIDPENARFNLGVQAMPWLILTDGQRNVLAEGFALSELTERLDGLQ